MLPPACAPDGCCQVRIAGCSLAVNPNVEIKEVPARSLVALSWHGNSPREAEVERRTAQLRDLMRQAGLAPKQGGKTHVWQYGEREPGGPAMRWMRCGAWAAERGGGPQCPPGSLADPNRCASLQFPMHIAMQTRRSSGACSGGTRC